jgi:hypothetical protein
MSTGSTLADMDGKVRKYFRLVLTSTERGTLFQKDLDVKDLFGNVVRVLVSNMVTEGILTEGLSYSAVIIPRYGGAPRFKPEASVDTQPRKQLSGWLSLEFDDTALPNTPISYCTMEVRVKGMPLTCRQDFKLQVEHAFSRLEKALAKNGILHEEDKYTYDLFAREDNESELEAEKGYLSKAEADELVEISPDEEGKVELPEKSLADYEIKATIGREPLPESVQIVITRSAFKAVQTIARNGAKVEEGGVLVGNVFKVPSSSTHLVEISGHIFAEEARGSEFELRYTFESWQKRTAELKEKFPGRRVVGWYHTHLVKARVFDEQEQQSSMTEHFFSASDHFMHRQFFPEKWYVAMVLNPSGEAVFFQWNGNDIVRSNGFYVVDDEPSPES